MIDQLKPSGERDSLMKFANYGPATDLSEIINIRNIYTLFRQKVKSFL